MKASICITVYNEERSITRLLGSLINQTKKPNEIVIVDGGSTDKTVDIIRRYQKKNKIIKLQIKKCMRAQGRNLSVKLAKNDIVAITDADCVADKNWLERITKPFKNKEVDIVAGFYKMMARNSFQKAEAVFLGVTPSKFSTKFLPSTRSIAFKKSIWDKIGGFPEGKENSAEDTDFNYKAVKMGAKFTRVKNALVEWGIPKTYEGYFNKIFSYAKWDAKYGIWWHPVQKFASHNIKVLFIFLRYILGSMLLILALSNPLFWPFLLTGLIFYIFWAFRKVFLQTNNKNAGLWGIVLQFSADFAAMTGFIRGLFALVVGKCKFFNTKSSKKLIDVILILMLAAYLSVLPIRSILYVVRIISEFTQPIEPYYEYINPCDSNYSPQTPEEERYYMYYNLDAKCEK